MVDAEAILDPGERPWHQVPVEVVDEVDEGEDSERVGSAGDQRGGRSAPRATAVGEVIRATPIDRAGLPSGAPGPRPTPPPAPRWPSAVSKRSAPVGSTSARFGWSPGQHTSRSQGHGAEPCPDTAATSSTEEPAAVHPRGVVRLDGVGDGEEAGDGACHAHHPDTAREGRQGAKGARARRPGRRPARPGRGIGVDAALGQPDRADVQAPPEEHRAGPVRGRTRWSRRPRRWPEAPPPRRRRRSPARRRGTRAVPPRRPGGSPPWLRRARGPGPGTRRRCWHRARPRWRSPPAPALPTVAPSPRTGPAPRGWSRAPPPRARRSGPPRARAG